MPSPAETSAVLADWLGDAADPRALDALFRRWAAAAGLTSAGLVWPAARPAGVLAAAGPDRGQLPPALAGVVPALRTADVVPDPDRPARLFALVPVPGRPDGVLWAEPWPAADRDGLRLAARVVGRSPALAARLGPAGDPARLAQRLDDAGVVAGRLAHDLNNVLAGVLGFADLARPHLPAGHPASGFLAECAAVGRTGLGFAEQLHQFARGGEARPAPGSVAAALAGYPEVVAVVPPDLPPVAMAAGPLGVVVGHLVRNAVEATPAAGRVEVAARVAELSPAEAVGYYGRVGPGEYVEVAVRDYGPGVAPEALGRPFADPFFTTKARHRGLGLATVFRVVTAHRGGVRLDPAAGPGTVARVALPPAARRP